MFGEKLAWIIGIGTGYSWFYLSFFLYSSFRAWLTFTCSLPTYLCLSEKRNKFRLFYEAQVFFFSTPPLKRDSHHTVASCFPPFDRKTLKNCACSSDPGLLNKTKGLWFPLSCFFLLSFSTWGCSILSLKKRKRALRPDPFFVNDSDIFLKYLNSYHNLPSYSLFSKCVSWFSYLGVHRGTGFFSWFYFSLLLSHVTRSRTRLALASVWPKKTLKNCACSADPGLNETKGSWFPLSCLSS